MRRSYLNYTTHTVDFYVSYVWFLWIPAFAGMTHQRQDVKSFTYAKALPHSVSLLSAPHPLHADGAPFL